jgi:deoxyhypusine monooxygenase
LETVTDERLSLFVEMESKYENNDTEYFISLLNHPDYVVRTRATCILVDFGGEDKIPHIAAIPPLIDSTLNDSSMFVRHEAVIALGVVGNKDAKKTLQKALNDPDKPVVESAVVALSNIEFMETLSKNEKFAKLTGG